MCFSRALNAALLAAGLAALAPPPVWAQPLIPPIPAVPPAPPIPAMPPSPAEPGPSEAHWVRFPHATELRLRDVAAIIHVVPESRADIAIAIVNPGPLRTPEVRARRQRVTIEGDLDRDERACRARAGGGFEVRVGSRRWIGVGQLPVIYVRAPRDVDLSASGAMQLRVGRAETLRAALRGCGDADLEGASGAADVSIAGDGPGVRLYDSGTATVSIAGEGEVVLGVVRRGLTVSIAGDGDIRAARVDGPTSVALQGDGDVIIREGRASSLSVVIAGDGDVTHNGVADRLDVTILGDGDVRVGRVDGPVARRVLGGGDVVIGR